MRKLISFNGTIHLWINVVEKGKKSVNISKGNNELIIKTAFNLQADEQLKLVFEQLLNESVE